MIEVQIPARRAVLSGNLTIPENAMALVLFAHGSGSSRHSPRNQFVARTLNRAGLGTLLFDLLTPEEEALDIYTREHRFNIGLLAERLVHATKWARQQEETRDLLIGYFGSSTGGAAALVAAAELPQDVGAVVSRGGRPDLAGDALPKVQAPTLLIVGGNDDIVIELNEMARDQMRCEVKLEIIPGATHLFEEAGALEHVAKLASDWFVDHLGAGSAQPLIVIPTAVEIRFQAYVASRDSSTSLRLAQHDALYSRVLRHLSIWTFFGIRHWCFVIRCTVATLPHKLFVPQIPDRRHSSCTIWL